MDDDLDFPKSGDQMLCSMQIPSNEIRSRVACKMKIPVVFRMGNNPPDKVTMILRMQNIDTDGSRRSTLIIQELQIASPAKLGC